MVVSDRRLLKCHDTGIEPIARQSNQELETLMKREMRLVAGFATILLVIFTRDTLGEPPDKYALKVPGGLSFSEFEGYERWQTISVSHTDQAMAVIVGNPTMIEAYRAGTPANAKPFPDGAKMAKIHWTVKRSEYPGNPRVPDAQHDVDFMTKDSKRFADSGGWGYAAFEYDSASQRFRPADANDTPPQASDAKCGLACHTVVKSRDYVFTDYAHR